MCRLNVGCRLRLWYPRTMPAHPCSLGRLAQIYGQVASGFADGNPYLRELTLKSMAVLGPKLSQKTLNQSLLKHLAKLQVRVCMLDMAHAAGFTWSTCLGRMC